MRTPTPGSSEWFEQQPTKRLKRMMRDNMPGSANHRGARDELARRAGDRQEKLLWATLAISAIAAAGAVVEIFQ